MKSIFIDTNIIIDYSKGYSQILQPLLDLLSKNEAKLFTNSVVIAEYFTDINLENKEKYNKALEFFHSFENLTIDKEVGIIAGKLLRQKSINGPGDALIAATCLKNKILLATRDKKDFKNVKKLKLFTL